jgi:hypothetical protein
MEKQFLTITSELLEQVNFFEVAAQSPNHISKRLTPK